MSNKQTIIAGFLEKLGLKIMAADALKETNNAILDGYVDIIEYKAYSKHQIWILEDMAFANLLSKNKGII